MAESFGLMFNSGDGDRTILDSEFSRLCVIYKGVYIPTENGGATSTTYFPAPITTQEQPLVFIRPDAANGILGMSPRVLGTPGNWTGFRIAKFNMYTINPKGTYFAANFEAQPKSDFGLRLFDASSKMIFDSGTPTALFVRSTNTWTYKGGGTSSQGVPITYFDAPFSLLENEYLLVNNLSMGTCTSSSQGLGRELYVMWNYPTQVLSLAMVAVQNTIATGLTIMIARIVQ